MPPSSSQARPTATLQGRTATSSLSHLWGSSLANEMEEEVCWDFWTERPPWPRRQHLGGGHLFCPALGNVCLFIDHSKNLHVGLWDFSSPRKFSHGNRIRPKGLTWVPRQKWSEGPKPMSWVPWDSPIFRKHIRKLQLFLCTFPRGESLPHVFAAYVDSKVKATLKWIWVFILAHLQTRLVQGGLALILH